MQYCSSGSFAGLMAFVPISIGLFHSTTAKNFVNLNSCVKYVQGLATDIQTSLSTTQGAGHTVERVPLSSVPPTLSYLTWPLATTIQRDGSQ